MKLEAKVEAVNKFCIASSGSMFYLKNNNLLIDSKVIKTLDNSFGDNYIIGTYLIWQDFNGVFDVYNEEGKFILRRDGYINYSNNTRYLYYYDTQVKVLKKIDIQKDIQFNNIISNGHIDGNNFYVIDKKHIIVFSLITNTPIWHYNLPETFDWQRRVASIEKPYETTKAEIEKILGVYEGIVYFVLNSGRVVGLDVDTGIELFTKVEPDSITIAYEKERIYTPTILWQNTQLDAEKGVIFGLLGNFYAEIDLKDPSRTYRVFDMDYSNNTKRIKCTNWGVCIGDEIFFAETNFAREPATVGIFNRKTKQVTWTSDVLGEEGDFSGLKKLDYANERLYVLDNENTLHIFNRN